MAVVLVFAGNVEGQASGAALRAKQAINSLGTKAFNKVVTWGAIALLSTTAIPCNVSARCDTTQSTQQAVQTQAPVVVEQQTSLRIPLYDAVTRLGYSELKELLEAGVIDVNAKDKQGNTALHTPYVENLVLPDSQTLSLVLAHSANPKIQNNAGESLYHDFDDLHDYLGGGEPEANIFMADLMVELFGINGKGKDGETALGYALGLAAYSEKIDLARELVAAGADVRIPNYYGSAGINNPLEAAAVLGDRGMFISLLFEQEEGIVNVLTQRGEHLLKLADRWDNDVMVDVLRDYGVNNDAKKHTIPLYDTVTRLGYSELEELLETGVIAVNARDENGNTALHTPYVKDLVLPDSQALRLVLTHGADPKIQNNAGESLYNDFDDLFDYLGGGEPEASMFMVDLMLELFGINGKDKDGAPLAHALAWADYSEEIDLARELVAAGADVRILDYYGLAGINNPLEAAAVLVTDRKEFISLLFEQEEGIVNILTQRGEHLLKLADRWDNDVVVDVLRDYGVKQ